MQNQIVKPDVLVLIPARGGSTRVKNKNLRPLKGKPLLSYAVTAAKASAVGRVVVSTNARDIAACANEYGAETPYLRPDELSGASAASIWVILHGLKWFKENEGWIPTFVVFLPPTNPFLEPTTIVNMVAELKKHPEMNSIVTVAPPKTHPFKIVKKLPSGQIVPGYITIDGESILTVERSQDYPVVWEGSPACRITRAEYFFDQLKDEMDVSKHAGKTYDADKCLGYEIDAKQCHDIDTETDFAMTDLMMT